MDRGFSQAPAGGEAAAAPAAPNPLAGMIAGLLEDPDVKEALQNPKVKAAYDDVVANGMMAGMKYFGDPDCAPIIQQIVRTAARMPPLLCLCCRCCLCTTLTKGT